jgi:hypothetical protein
LGRWQLGRAGPDEWAGMQKLDWAVVGLAVASALILLLAVAVCLWSRPPLPPDRIVLRYSSSDGDRRFLRRPSDEELSP